MLSKRDEALIAGVLDAVRAFYEPRIKALESRAPEKGDKGDQGEPGKDAAPVDLSALIESLKVHIPEPIKGDPGSPGEPGAPGKDGANGKDGRDGIDGKDGLDGKNGEAGPAGKDGVDGKDGLPGKDGENGSNGKDGRDGVDGKNGANGVDGKDGRDGVDAAKIEPLNGIDQTRSYPRGTWAFLRGGIVYAERTTDPVDGDLKAAGWVVAMNGIDDFGVSADGRSLAVRTALTDGGVEESTTRLAIPEHRGVFRQGVTYEKGDVVSWEGSSWIAKRATEEKPGSEGSQGWALLARRGRNGKDL